MKRAALLVSSLILSFVSQSSHAHASSSEVARQCDLKLSYQPLGGKNLPELRSALKRVFVREFDTTKHDRKRDSTGFLLQTDTEDLRIWRHPFESLYQAVPRKISEKRLGSKYDLDIMGGINYKFGNYTEKRGKRMRLTLFSMILGSLLITTPTVPLQIRAGDVVDDTTKDVSVDFKIVTHWNKWGEKVKYDYRDHDVNLELKNGKISGLTAREEAYRKTLVYKDFSKYLTDKNEIQDYTHQKYKLENSELFSHIEDLKKFMKGDKVVFFALRPGPMTDEQEAMVFKSDEQLYLNYEVVSEWAHSGAPRNLDQFPNEFKSQMTSLLNNEFAQKLLNLRDEHVITNLELQFLLQRDLSDQHDYEIQGLLGLIPYQFGTKGFIDQFDTTSLEDMRKETLKNIRGDLKASL